MSDSRGRGDPGDDAVPIRIRGGFDLSHLQAVHRHLFDGVDPDAGQRQPPRSIPVRTSSALA